MVKLSPRSGGTHGYFPDFEQIELVCSLVLEFLPEKKCQNGLEDIVRW
jgi:hypothetical protein